MKHLLAKSYNKSEYPGSPPDYALLTQHSRDVATACDALAETVGPVTLSNAGLNEGDLNSFRLHLRAIGWMQDLGKVSSHFQQMVSGAFQITQLIRHETISGLLMLSRDLPLRSWLTEKFSEENLLSIVWSAMGHHRKFDRFTNPFPTTSLTAAVSHPDFLTILEEMANDLNLSAVPLLKRELVIAQTQRDNGDIGAREALRELQDEFTTKRGLFASDTAKRKLALLKGLGIAADVAASAIAFRGQSANRYSLRDFVSDSLRVGLSPDDLQQLIGEWAWSHSAVPRRVNASADLPPDFQPRAFQTDVAGAKHYLTLTVAGCGSGKSLAAYMWAREWSQRFTQAGRTNFRLFFCLPTTGTTTEHFKDYALESGIDPKLMSLTHSRAEIDLRAIAATAPQEDSTDTEKDAASAAEDALNAERDKIRSLSLWSTPLVVTTTDTVLGLMVNARRSIYSLPALMCGAFVFDEIHAFDDELFGHLLVFLKNFPGLPVLLMTASLPTQRLAALRRIRPDIDCIPGPPEFEELKRYSVRKVSATSDVHQAIKECLAEGGKVLWIRNQVEWANETYRDCRERYPDFFVDVYHSRLRYKDRSVRHRRVIDSFRQKAAAILIATQVAEMSLDLSADLLISDIAPIPSVIQRMGRLNRHMMPATPLVKREIKPALLCSLPSKPQAELPYEAPQLRATEDWIAYLTDRKEPLSQRDLAMCFARFSVESEFDFQRAEERACFFSGIWETRLGNTRREGHTISIILQQDKDELERQQPGAQPTSDWVREHEVAIPIHDEVLKWKRFGFVPVAPTDAVAYDYDELTNNGTGARWVKK